MAGALNDYRQIWMDPPGEAPRLLTVADTNRLFREDYAWLKEQACGRFVLLFVSCFLASFEDGLFGIRVVVCMHVRMHVFVRSLSPFSMRSLFSMVSSCFFHLLLLASLLLLVWILSSTPYPRFPGPLPR